MKVILIFLLLLTISCSGSKVSKNHGFTSLDTKFQKITINKTNKNDLISLIGPPSTISKFDENLWIYIERKKVKRSIFKLGTEKYISNNVLVLKINSKGLLKDKKIYSLKDMKDNYQFSENITSISYKNNSFVYNLLSSIKQRINAPTQRSSSRNK